MRSRCTAMRTMALAGAAALLVALLSPSAVQPATAQQHQHDPSSYNPFTAPMTITLFGGENYTGPRTSLGVGDAAQGATMHRLSSGADSGGVGVGGQVASAQLSAGMQADLFGNEECAGAALLSLRTRAPSLQALGLQAPVLCVRLQRLGECEGVVVYSDHLFSGEAQLLPPGRYEAASVAPGTLQLLVPEFDNSISSIWMAPKCGWTVLLYDGSFEHPAAASQHMTSVPDLTHFNFNDMASTVVVSKQQSDADTQQRQQQQQQELQQRLHDERVRQEHAQTQAHRNAAAEAAQREANERTQEQLRTAQAQQQHQQQPNVQQDEQRKVEQLVQDEILRQQQQQQQERQQQQEEFNRQQQVLHDASVRAAQELEAEQARVRQQQQQQADALAAQQAHEAAVREHLRVQAAAEEARLAADPHLRDLLLWQRAHPGADPFGPDAPAYATLYEHDQYTGHSTRVPCCESVGISSLHDGSSGAAWNGLSSLRLTAGVRVFLYESADCTGGSHNFLHNIPSLTGSPVPHLNDRVACVRLERLRSDMGIILFPDAHFQGEGQFFPPGSFETHQLYADNQASSVWLGSPFAVTLRDGSLHQHAASISFSGATPVATLDVWGFNDVTSSLSVAHSCAPACANGGECLGPNQCHCAGGWTGPSCGEALPDRSSYVLCDGVEYLLAEEMRCVLHARRDGNPVLARRGAFMLEALLPSATATATATATAQGSGENGGIVWAQPDEAVQSTQFAFTFRASQTSPRLAPQRLLRAQVNSAWVWPSPPGTTSADQHRLAGAQMSDLQTVPSVLVLAYPDGSSVLRCDRRRTLLHQRVSCVVEARREGRPVKTLARAFKLECSDKTAASLGKLVAVAASSAADAPSAAAGAKGRAAAQKPKKQKNDRVGSVMSFSYTALRVPGGSKPKGSRSGSSGKNVLSATCAWSAWQRPSGDASGESVPPPCFAPIDLVMSHAPPAESDYFSQAKQLVFQQRFPQALPLLRRSVALQPSHATEAMLLRSELYLLFGQYRHARADLNALARVARGERAWKKANVSEADAASAAAAANEPPLPKPDPALSRRVSSKLSSLAQVETQHSRGLLAHAMGQWVLASNHLSAALELAKYSSQDHLLRAECALKLGQYPPLKYDVLSVLHWRPRETRAMLLLARGYHEILGRTDAALANLRLCMRVEGADDSAPASASAGKAGGGGNNGATPCESLFASYSLVHAATERVEELARQAQWEGAAKAAEDAMSLDGDRAGPAQRRLLYRLCALYSRANSTHLHGKTVSTCSEGLRAWKAESSRREREGLAEDVGDKVTLFDLTLERGLAFLALGKHDAALSDLKVCIGLSPLAAGSLPPGHDGAARMEHLNAELNRAKEKRPVRDFYEVLGLQRDATRADIKRAYRRLALQYHPDKNDSPEAAAMFLEMTEAFAVLYNEVTRAKYDGGMGAEALRTEAQNFAQQRTAFQFNFGEMTEDGRVKAWFTNAEGEREETEFETHQSQQRKAQQDAERKAKADEEKKKEIPKHCCLPLGQGE